MATSFAGGIADAFNNLAIAPMAMVTAAQGLTGKLVGMGMVFLTIAFLSELVTALYSFWLGGDGTKFLGRVLRLFIITSIPLFALQNWGDASSFLPRLFQNNISQTLTGTVKPMDMVQAVIGVVDQFWNNIIGKMAGNWGNKSGVVHALLAPDDFLTNIFMLALAVLIFVVLVGVPAVLFAGILLATLFGTQIVTYIGVAVGPLMICFLPWQPAAWLAQSWLKFMITAGLTYVVAMTLAFICKAGAASVTAAMTLALSVPDTELQDLGVIAVILPLAATLGTTILFMAWLMHKSEDIAQAIVSGGASSSGGSFIAVLSRNISKMGGKGASTPKPKS